MQNKHTESNADSKVYINTHLSTKTVMYYVNTQLSTEESKVGYMLTHTCLLKTATCNSYLLRIAKCMFTLLSTEDIKGYVNTQLSTEDSKVYDGYVNTQLTQSYLLKITKYMFTHSFY